MVSNIKTCTRCGIQYDWRKSPSGYLKMTFCGSLCERASNGFTIEGLTGMVIIHKVIPPSHQIAEVANKLQPGIFPVLPEGLPAKKHEVSMKSFIDQHRSLRIGGVVVAVWLGFTYTIYRTHCFLKWLSVGADPNGLPKKYIRTGFHDTIQSLIAGRRL